MGNLVNILNEFDFDKYSVVFEDDYFKFFGLNNTRTFVLDYRYNGLIYSKIKQSFLFDKPLNFKYSPSDKLLHVVSRYEYGKVQLVNLKGDFLLNEWEYVDFIKFNDKFIKISIKTWTIREHTASIQSKMENVWNIERQCFVFDEWVTIIFYSDNHLCFYDKTKGYRICDKNCNLVSDKWFEDVITLGYPCKTSVLLKGEWFYFDENDNLIQCNENDSNSLNECNKYQNNKTIKD